MDDILKRASHKLTADVLMLNELAAERDVLAEAYHRYMNNLRAAARHEQSAKAMLGFLGSLVDQIVKRDEAHAQAWKGVDWVVSAKNMRERAAVWEHLQQYLQLVPEARVDEILGVMERLGIPANRQAIESAVRQHPKVFGTRKEGREKFFYLKESS